MQERPLFPFPALMRYGIIAGLTGAPCSRPEHHAYLIGYRLGKDHPETARSWSNDLAKAPPRGRVT